MNFSWSEKGWVMDTSPAKSDRWVETLFRWQHPFESGGLFRMLQMTGRKGGLKNEAVV